MTPLGRAHRALGVVLVMAALSGLGPSQTAAQSISPAGGHKPAACDEACCWIDAKTGKAYPPSRLVPLGMRPQDYQADSNHFTSPHVEGAPLSDVNWVRDPEKGWINAKTGTAYPCSRLVPLGMRPQDYQADSNHFKSPHVEGAPLSDINWVRVPCPPPEPSKQQAALSSPGCDTSLLAVLNQVRADPASYAASLATYRTYFRGNLVAEPGRPLAATTEGVVAVDAAIADLRMRAPAPALQFDARLSASSSRLAEDLGPKGGVGHTGSDGSTLRTRMQDAGVYASVMEEDVSLMQTTSVGIVRQLIIDDGVPSRGHRDVVFNPDLKWVGFGGAPHKTYGGMCVIDFAGGFMSPPPPAP